MRFFDDCLALYAFRVSYGRVAVQLDFVCRYAWHVMIKKMLLLCLMCYSCSAISQQGLEKPSLEKNNCPAGYVNLRGVCSNPVPVAPRDFTAATINDSGLSKSSIDFIERLRK